MNDPKESEQGDRYQYRIAKTAEKDLVALQPKQFKQIVTKIFSLQDNPRPHDCGALQGYEGYRVDQGEYRILYTINDEKKSFDVFRIRKRNDDEAYRNLASVKNLKKKK